jgi:uncharacterized protein YbaR (Trm112 family)
MTVSTESLLKLLVCPVSHAPLVREATHLVSTDPLTRLQYPVRDGIPVMLVEEAHTLPPEEWAEIMRRHGHDPLTTRSTTTSSRHPTTE